MLQNKKELVFKNLLFRLADEHQVKAIEAVFKIYLNDEYDPSIRLGCALRFVRPLLQGCRRSAAREFFKRHIRTLQNMLNVTLDICDQIRAEHLLVGKIGAWNILEPLFVQLESSELENKECVITAAAFPNAVKTGKELISDLTTRYREKYE
jgi:hypothetical protein